MEETLIIFGNGEETTSNTRTYLGELEAIVCNDDQFTDDLVAIHHIVDAGYNIHLYAVYDLLDSYFTKNVGLSEIQPTLMTAIVLHFAIRVGACSNF
jgi:hypothetical protein